MNSVAQVGRRAFTLVELLTVVAILALLLSLLMPTLARTKEVTRTTVCTSNLRQLGGGATLYRTTYRMFFWPRLLSGSGSVFLWAGKRGAGGTGYDAYGADVRWVNPFVGGPFGRDAPVPICHCPSDTWIYDYFGSSYGANNAHDTGARFPRSNLAKDDNVVRTASGGCLSSSRVRRPGLWVLAAEHGANHWAWDDPNRYFPGKPYDVHSIEQVDRLDDKPSSFNLLFGDGHAGSMVSVQVGVLNTGTYAYDY